VSATVCVPPEVLKVTAPVCEPIVVGAKVTDTVQLAPAARLAGHPCVAANGPDAVTEFTLTAVLPVLLSCTVCAVETVFTGWPVNDSDPVFTVSEV
jgi:hypothetical protein